jgi:sigma-E factor negative regulatory protein RseC
MEVERGVIEKLEEGWAWVEIKRKGACESCGHKGHCKMSDGDERVMLKAENLLGARIGDEVEINFHGGIRLKSAFMAYILPVLGLLCGAAVGMGAANSLGWNRDACSVLFALMGLVLAFSAAYVFDKSIKGKKEYIPSVARIRIPFSGELAPLQSKCESSSDSTGGDDVLNAPLLL